MKLGKLGEVNVTATTIEKIIKDISYNRKDWTSRILNGGVEAVQERIYLLATGKKPANPNPKPKTKAKKKKK